MRYTRLRIVFGVVLLLILALVTGKTVAKDISFTTKSPEAQALLQQALEKYNGLQFPEARELFLKVTGADPDCAIAYYFLANTATTTEEFAKNLKKAIALAPNASIPEQVMIQAAKAGLEGKTPEVNKLMQRLVQVAPGAARAHVMLGDNLSNRQQYSEAEAEYRKAIELDPKFALAYNQLAYTLAGMGRHAEAIEALKKYAELRQKEPNPHDSMGEIYLWMGDNTNSIAEYNASLAIDPTFSGSILGLGNNYLFMGQFDKARETYDSWLLKAKDYGDSALVFTWRTWAYLHEGRADDAVKELTDLDAFGKAHNDLYLQITAHSNLASMYLLRWKELEKATAENQIVLNLIKDPGITTAVRDANMRGATANEAMILAYQGKPAEAMAKYAELKKLAETIKTPDMARTLHYVKGEIALGGDDCNLALDEFGQADLQNPWVKYRMAGCYEKLGKTKEAKEIYGWIVKWNHNDFNLAVARPEAMKKI